MPDYRLETYPQGVRERLHFFLILGIPLVLVLVAVVGSRLIQHPALDDSSIAPPTPPQSEDAPPPASPPTRPTVSAPAPADPALTPTEPKDAENRDARQAEGRERLRRLAERTRGLVPPLEEMFRPAAADELAMADIDLGATLALLRAGRLSPEQQASFLPWIRHLADAGDTALQVELTGLLARGLIEAEAPGEALRRALIAAEAGSAEGALFVARALEQGSGTEADPVLARDWYAYAAEHGQPDAWAELGFLASLGSAAPVDHALALDYYQRAFDEGSALGARRLGVAHLEGWGVDQDPALAREWLELAGSMGDAGAYVLLRAYSKDGLFGPRDQDRENQYLLAAAQSGDSGALLTLALRDLVENEGKAGEGIASLIQQAREGTPRAMFALASTILGQRDVNRIAEAESLYRMGAELGDPHGYYRLAMLNAHPVMSRHLAEPQDPVTLLETYLEHLRDYRALLIRDAINAGDSADAAFRRYSRLTDDEAYVAYTREKYRTPNETPDEALAIDELSRRPLPVKTTTPTYPITLREEGVSGEVRVEFWIRRDGSVDHIRILESTHPLFSASVEEALSQWRFEPGIKDDKPVSVIARVSIPFNVHP